MSNAMIIPLFMDFVNRFCKKNENFKLYEKMKILKGTHRLRLYSMHGGRDQVYRILLKEYVFCGIILHMCDITQ